MVKLVLVLVLAEMTRRAALQVPKIPATTRFCHDTCTRTEIQMVDAVSPLVRWRSTVFSFPSWHPSVVDVCPRLWPDLWTRHYTVWSVRQPKSCRSRSKSPPSLARAQTHSNTHVLPRSMNLNNCSQQGKGNKLMDQTFETFMDELREEKGPEEDTVTRLCQKDRPPVGVR